MGIREDVNALGRTLGQVLKEQEGEAFFELVERTRALVREVRQSATIDGWRCAVDALRRLRPSRVTVRPCAPHCRPTRRRSSPAPRRAGSTKAGRKCSPTPKSFKHDSGLLTECLRLRWRGG